MRDSIRRNSRTDWRSVFRPLIVAAFVAATSNTASALPAFPGAEGFGSETRGGRGGRVIAVTNLDDDGPGSLRAACRAKGARIVVFRVGGTIRLKKHLRITEPFITIAGQSAPGGGILLRDAGLWIETHDVVVRFIRVRIGPSLNEYYGSQDCVHIEGKDCCNVVVDHCSFSWSVDECASARGPAHDITFSWNIIAEALRTPFTNQELGKDDEDSRSHSMGMMLGGNPDRCSVHHNLIAHCNSRNPRIQGGTHAFVNNVVYDWGYMTATFSRDPKVNFIGNYYRRGPSSLDQPPIVNEQGLGKVYVKGNRSSRRPSDSLPEWELTTDAPVAHQAKEPFAMPPLKITSADQALEDVLAHAGCTLPQRDAVDDRILRNARLGMGGKIDRPEQVGGYPEIAAGAPPRDSDADGMPDDWETAQRLDPNDPTDGPKDRDRDGYTNVEEYLNSIVEQWMHAKASVKAYPVPDAAGADCPFEVEAEGVKVPVQEFGQEIKVYYARFRLGGKVTVQVKPRKAGKVTCVLKPDRYLLNLRVKEGAVLFDVDQPGPRVLHISVDGKDLPPLFVIADELERDRPDPSDPKVLNVLDHGIISSDSEIQTAKIQALLDQCATSGGTVYFAGGIYRTGTLRIGRNTTIYLEAGALIKASENPEDFPITGVEKETGGEGISHSGSRLLYFYKADNSRLAGCGEVDGMGHILRNRHDRRVQVIDAEQCSNLTIENVVLRNSASWTCHVLYCNGVDIRNLKILGDWKVGNTDGIDPDSSRNVRITRYFGYCGDDALAIKTTGNSGLLQSAENITVRDSVVITRKTGLKLGTESRADIRHILFENVDVVDSSRGIGLWMRDGSTFEDVTFRDVTMDLHEIPGEGWSGEPYRITVESRRGIGKIRNVLFDRVKCSAPYRSVIHGHPDSPLEGVKFWGCEWVVKPREDKMNRAPVMDIQRAKNVEFRFTKLDWRTKNDDVWNGFLGLSDVEGLSFREFEERRD